MINDDDDDYNDDLAGIILTASYINKQLYIYGKRCGTVNCTFVTKTCQIITKVKVLTLLTAARETI
jgi:hypothetical protein